MCLSGVTAQAGIVASPDGKYRVSVEVDQPAPYLGQAVIYRVKFYAETATAYEYTAPKFNGWWRGEQLTTAGSSELIDSRQYSVVRIETLLYPLQAGTLVIEPAQLIIPETVFTAQIELISPRLTLQVQPLPPNPPSTFTGAVGRYRVSVEVDQPTVMLGMPLTLRYRLNGEGNLAALPPPSLSFPDGWRGYANPSTLSEQTRGFGERVFEWRLIPERAGSYAFPAYAFSYFDPRLSAYQTVEAAAFTVDVLPTPDGQRELIRFERRADQRIPMALTLKPVSSDALSPNLPNLNLAWLIPPMIVLSLWSSQRVIQWQRGRRIRQRQAHALQNAAQRLQALTQLSPAAPLTASIEAYRGVQLSIAQYVADKLNLASMPAHFQDISEALAPYALDKALLGALWGCWQQAEDGRYAPFGVIDLASLTQKTAATLTALDRSMQPFAPIRV